MGKIVKKDGYVYYVEGEKGFETFHNLGKDPSYWESLENENKEVERPKKRFNRKKNEDEN